MQKTQEDEPQRMDKFAAAVLVVKSELVELEA